MPTARAPAPRHQAAEDARFMQLAVAQARHGLGHTRPNPAVGAVVVRDGRVLGQGYHHRAGQPHAEVEAIVDAGGDVRGATMYVTLEPCDHQGRTGPCTARLIEAGVARVVVGCVDPNPRVQGRGIRRLRRHRIQVDVGVELDACTALIEGYAHHIVGGRPLVILKAAISLDGRLATRTGDSRGLSGPEAQAHLHALRARCDAIVVGVGTVLADDPRLTVRIPDSPPAGTPDLVRVVVDSTARTPPHSRVVRGPGTCLVAVTRRVPATRRHTLERAGAEILVCRSRGAQVSLRDLMRRLGARGLMSVLVEGGGGIHGSLLREGLVDRVALYVTPHLIGGDGVPLLRGPGRGRVADTPLGNPRWTPLGQDMLVEAALPSR